MQQKNQEPIINNSDLLRQWSEIEGGKSNSPKVSNKLNDAVVRHIMAVLTYTKGYCQRNDFRKIAAEIEQKAIASTAEMDVTPEEAIAEYAVESGKIDELEKLLNESMRESGKPVRKRTKNNS